MKHAIEVLKTRLAEEGRWLAVDQRWIPETKSLKERECVNERIAHRTMVIEDLEDAIELLTEGT